MDFDLVSNLRVHIPRRRCILRRLSRRVNRPSRSGRGERPVETWSTGLEIKRSMIILRATPLWIFAFGRVIRVEEVVGNKIIIR